MSLLFRNHDPATRAPPPRSVWYRADAFDLCLSPYLTARIVGSLDQISGGRAGWNMVTGSSDLSAKNFGMEHLPPHDQRYDMADEYIAICKRLWGSWQPDAIVADERTGVLIDPARVRTIDYEGRFYKCRGPLNSGPCPQVQPVIAQAGGSARGRRLASEHADTIVAHVKGIEQMKAYRDDVRATMASLGRDPDTCKILFLVSPILAETTEEAKAKADQRADISAQNVDKRLAQLGWITNIDFAEFDLTRPLANSPPTDISRAWRNSCGRQAGAPCARRSSATRAAAPPLILSVHQMRLQRRWAKQWKRWAAMVFCFRCRM